MEDWETVKLGDVIELDTGYPFKSKNFTENEEDIPLVKGSNLQQGYIDWNEAKKWPKEEFEDFKDYELKEGDVVLAMDRPWVSAGLKYSWIKSNDPRSLLVQRIARLRSNGKLWQDYLRYLIASRNFTDYIKPIVTGVNVPHISPDQIKSFEFNLPPLSIQKEVASILSPFDELIKNNSRRIDILEEMARRIYREWFVHFRYPGHEDDKLVDSGTELGEIPEGWEVKRLEDIIDLNYGKGLRKKDRVEGKFPVYGSSGVIDWHNDYQVEGPGVIVGRKGNVGSMFWEYKNFNPIDTTFYVETLLPLTYAFYNLQNQNFINSDAAVPGLSKRQASTLPFLVPNEKILKSFDTKILQLFDLKRVLNEKNEKLKETRDLLLPNLISGKIDVEALNFN